MTRKTAYKYLDRYLNEGVAGFQERSRKPHKSPGATTEEVRTLLIAEKKRRKTWGPKKLVDELGIVRTDAKLDVPAWEHPQRGLHARPWYEPFWSSAACFRVKPRSWSQAKGDTASNLPHAKLRVDDWEKG